VQIKTAEEIKKAQRRQKEVEEETKGGKKILVL